GGVLDQFRALGAGHDDRGRNRSPIGLGNGVGALVVAAIGEGSVDFAQNLGRAVAVAPDHDAVGKQEVGNGGPLAQEFGIGGYVEYLGIGAVAQDDLAHPFAGIDRNRALLDDDLLGVCAAGYFTG